MRARSIATGLSGLVAGVALLPVGVLVVLGWGAEGVAGPGTGAILANTLALTAATVLGSLLIGVPLALATTYGQLPGGRLWVGVLAAPLAMPSYLGAFAFFAAFGPGGAIERALGLPTPSVHGLVGAALVMTLYTFPFVFLTTRAALRRLDAHVLDAARTLGMPVAVGLWRIVLPRIRNGIAAGGLLVALYTLSDFGTPAILGVDTFTRRIYVEYNAFGLDRAALLSLQLLILVGLVLFLESRVGATRERPGRHPQWRLDGPTRVGVVALCVGIAVIALGLPLGVFGLWLWREGPAGFDPVLVWHSMYPAFLAALGALLVAIPVAQAAQGDRLGRLFERITYIGFGIPGIVLGTALVYVGLQLGFLYQTLALLVIGYVLRFVPLAVGAVRSSLDRFDGQLIGAARSLGASPAEAFRRVTLPLILPGLTAGAALVFLEVMRELPTPLLLAPTGFENLATYLWRVYEAGYFGRGAIPGLALVAVSTLAVLILVSGSERRRHGDGSSTARDS